MNEQALEASILDALSSFTITQIPDNTRFWMIRTKKGYFYHEFIQKKFVALAWNTITAATDFSDAASDRLNDHILLTYNNIKRPTLVSNKCKSFIHDIKAGDILVIPSEGSQYITFAYAGEYFEEDSKTPELEENIISRIEHSDVLIDEVSCPFKKRRHITPIRTIRGDEVNHHLYRAISSYHGISSLDGYGSIVLDHIFNCHQFSNQIRLVFHVSKTDAITSKEFSGFIYAMNCILSSPNMDESAISIQTSVHSVGDIVITLKEAATWLSQNYLWFVGIAAVIGGGKFAGCELPGIVKIFSDAISLKNKRKLEQAQIEEKNLENLQKKVDIAKAITSTNENPEHFLRCLELLGVSGASMQIRPYDTIDAPTITSSSEPNKSDDEEQNT